ncbi:hypothetical protein RB195_021437 [Necator americanus]|uniref:Uncharacterized protein n=1 Tax=Necator americanus TaxID=51031 RepID=A0ABR1EDK1_NECAM
MPVVDHYHQRSRSASLLIHSPPHDARIPYKTTSHGQTIGDLNSTAYGDGKDTFDLEYAAVKILMRKLMWCADDTEKVSTSCIAIRSGHSHPRFLGHLLKRPAGRLSSTCLQELSSSSWKWAHDRKWKF